MTAILFGSHTLQAQSACCISGIPCYTITGVNKVSDLFPSPGGGGWPAGSIVVIDGTLLVDQSFAMTDLIAVRMTPGSRITVTGSGTIFTVSSSGAPTAITGCGGPWEGITVSSNAAVRFSGMQIMDANIGILFNGANPALTELSTCELRNCLNGMVILATNGLFKPNKFSNVTIRKFSVNSPAYFDELLHGIRLLGGSANLADNAESRNLISGYRYGIRARASNLRVANMEVRECISTFDDPNDGVGLLALDNSLIHVGGSGNFRCKFQSNQNIGIHATGIRLLDVSGASFTTNRRYDVLSEKSVFLSSPLLYARIHENEFMLGSQNMVSSVYLERRPNFFPVTGVDISHNAYATIKTSDLSDTMHYINIQGLGESADYLYVRNNNLQLLSNAKNANGIRIAGFGNNKNILNNTLAWKGRETGPNALNSQFFAEVRARGIHAHDLTGNFHLIDGNTITSRLNGQASFLRSGIQINTIQGHIHVCENTLDKLHRGIYTYGPLTRAKLKTNLMKESAYALYSEASTDMLNQTGYENLFPGPYATLSGFYDISQGIKFQFIVNPMLPNHLAPDPRIPPDGWFDGNTGVISDPYCGFGAMTGITDSEAELIDAGYEVAADAPTWDRQRSLFAKLLGGAYTSGAATQYLLAATDADDSALAFAEAAHGLEQMTRQAVSGSLRARVEQLHSQITQAFDTLRMLDVLQAQDSTRFDTLIASDAAAVFAHICQLRDTLDQELDLAKAEVSQAIQTFGPVLSALPANTLYEQNLKILLGYALRSMWQDSLGEAQYAQLRDIVNQCPLIGGISVRLAAMWLPREEGLLYVDRDDDAICNAEERMRAAAAPQHELRIAPNPAVRTLWVSHAQPGARWRISDARGQVLQEGLAPTAEFVIEMRQLVSGLYFLTMDSPSGPITRRFVVK